MQKTNRRGVVFSSHIGTERENIGDVLSAKAVAKVHADGTANFSYFSLSQDSGLSASIPVIYGGGGMIRPQFAEREVYKDFQRRLPRIPYAIYGVGLNCDIHGPDFSSADIDALRKWITNAQSAHVRDFETQEFVRSVIGTECQVSPCPTYDVLKSIFVLPMGRKYEIGFVMSSGHTETYARYKENIVRLVNGLIEKVGRDNIRIICHDSADYEFSKDLFGKDLSIVMPEDFRSVRLEYSRCRSIITLRGHGVIFAAASNLPCSLIPLCGKLNSIYYYHYRDHAKALSFDPKKHYEHLARRILPLDLRIGSIARSRNIKRQTNESGKTSSYRRIWTWKRVGAA